MSYQSPIFVPASLSFSHASFVVPLNDSLGAFIEALEREVRLSKVAIYCAAALSLVL